MSIRSKQLLLLMVMALLPVLLSAWHSVRQIDSITATIGANTRANLLQRERRYMQEKVADIGRALELTGRATITQLRQQQLLLEKALRQEPDSGRRLLMCDDVPQLPDAVADTRFARTSGDDWSSTYIKVSYDEPGFLFRAAPRDAATARHNAQQLAAAGADLKRLYRQAGDTSLWHYAALDSGVSMVYPGHGEYPDDFDPRQRPWYQRTKASNALTWLPLTIDASTGQPVLTVAAPIRDAAGTSIGVTAIDLPLQQLLRFQSATQPWLTSARLALLADVNGDIAVIATKEPLQLNSNWHTDPQRRLLHNLSSEQEEAIRQLHAGDSLLLEGLNMHNQPFLFAVTALNQRGTSWLALASPLSAIQQEVDTALTMLDAKRSATVRQHTMAAGMLALIAIVISHIVAKRATQPLITMSKTAEALASGNLDSRTGLRRTDEIGQLSTSIDHLADNIEQLLREQEEAYRSMLTTLTRALEKKDSYTAAHSGRVTRYALQLGRRIGLDDDTLEKLRFGALTHDLGKIGIADNILNKPAALTEAEYDIMKQHPSFSRSIMKPLVRFREYAQIAGSHHENWDGSGYPDGLQGEQIPLLARIVAIADTWDAMTGDRVYRKGMPREKALAILDQEKDLGQFDPHLIREFLALVRAELDTKPDPKPPGE